MAKKGKSRAVDASVKETVNEQISEQELPQNDSENQAETSQSGSDFDADDSEDEGVDEEAMDKLMKLLGDVDPAELGLDDEELDGEDVDGSQDGEEEDESLLQDVTSDANGLEEDGKDSSDSENSDPDDDEELLESDEEEIEQAQPTVSQSATTKKQDDILDKILARFKIDVPFFETQTLTYPAELEIPNAQDDLQRELQFYKQSLWAAQHAYKLFKAASAPFTRPADYYAEMLKSDDHMERIRQKLLDESASIKASENAKKQRHLKKFGKQVQVEKLKEREKSKKDLNDRVKEFKKKRKDAPGADDRDDFDIEAVNEMSSTRAHKRARNASYGESSRGGGRPSKTREQRDAKFGRPKTSRRPKENDRESANNISGAAGRGGRAAMSGRGGGRGGRGGGRGGGGRGGKRLGKSRRS